MLIRCLKHDFDWTVCFLPSAGPLDLLPLLMLVYWNVLLFFLRAFLLWDLHEGGPSAFLPSLLPSLPSCFLVCPLS